MIYRLYWLDENQKVKWRFFKDPKELFEYSNTFLKGTVFYYRMPRTGSWIERKFLDSGIATSFSIQYEDIPDAIRLFYMVTT